MIGALHLRFVIALSMQATAADTALSVRALESASQVSSQHPTRFGATHHTRKNNRPSPGPPPPPFPPPAPTSLLPRPQFDPTTRRDVSQRASSPDEWLGSDKLRHLLMSMAVTQFTYGGLRTANMDADAALPIAIGVATVGGIGKEVRDSRHDGPFSLKDLAWDAAGIAIAGILLGSVR